MTPYALETTHETDNLTLLCPDHHAQKTRGLLSEAAVREANAAPANLTSGHSRQMSVLAGSTQLEVLLGSNRFLVPGTSFIPLMVDDIALLAVELEDRQMLLHANFFDALNTPVLQIIRSEVVYSVDTWDIEFVGQILTLRSGPRNIQLRLRFDPTGVLSIDRAELYCNGIQASINGGKIVVGGEMLTIINCTFEEPIGVHIGELPPGVRHAAINVNPPREGHASSREQLPAARWMSSRTLPALRSPLIASAPA
jgi:hypothetical protein